MKTIFLFATTLLFSISLHAKEISKVCLDYIKNPEAFQTVKTKLIEGKERFLVDGIDCGYSDDTGGSCNPETLTCSGYPADSKKSWDFFGYDEVPVQYQNKLYTFIGRRMGKDFKKVEYIGHISEKGTTLLCKLHQKIIQIKPQPTTSEVCKALSEGKVTRHSLADSNLERDGSKISYEDDGYSSGAGCGCDLESIKAKSTDSKSKAFTEAFNELNTNESSCHGDTLPLSWSVVRFDKKDYLFLENPKLKVGTLTHAHKKVQPEALYEWTGKEFVKLCTNTYKIELVAVEPEHE